MSKAIFSSVTEIKVSKNVIYRDISFYILATLMTLAFAVYGYLTIATSIIFLSLYVLLVLVVYIQDKFYPDDKEEEQSELLS